MRPARWCALAIVLMAGSAMALETDQYWAWGRPLADSTEAVNARFNLELEPGLGGGKLSVGWTRVTGMTNQRGSFLKAAFIGAAYKLTILRTWGENGWVPKNRTYAGFELGVPVIQANFGLGLLYRVDGGDGRKWTITGSVGWGF